MTTAPAPTQPTHPGNNFDAIRIVAATMVLVSHHFALTGQLEPSFLGVHSYGGLAVAIFFIISGYLVAASWQRDPNLWRFTLRRFLRIWPALTAVIVLTAYGLGAWVTELPLSEYLTHRATANYLRGLWMQIHFVLPGVFVHNPYALGVNGSLWTIPIEVRCYIVLGLAGLLGLLKYRSVFLLCIALFMAWFLLRSNADVSGAVNYGRELSAFFLAGAALHALESRWSNRPALWAAVVGASFAVTWAIGWRHTALLIGLPFAVIYAGTRATPYLRRAGRWGDPSYGIYLFAFPVQQTVIFYTWPDAGFAGTLLLALLITIALAYVSWHLIEKQALKLKPSNLQSESSVEFFRKACKSLASRQAVHWVWPLLAMAVGLRFIIKRLDAPVLIDPTYTYLPAARAFLEQGWSFLLKPESYQVTPLAYLWPALWGADPTSIRIANMGLWIGCVWFIWQTCYLLGGLRAGAVAMLLLLSPELVRYFPSEMTEPIFLFGLFGWMHAVARILIARQISAAVIVQGALMLTITLLSRPVLQLVTPTMLLICVLYLVHGSIFQKRTVNAEWRLPIRSLGWSMALALILPLMLIVKNGTVFGLWALGTGSGTGLYLGTHPLFQGAEPGFLGFIYDINAMISLAGQPGSHLSMDADRIASQAALWQLQSMPIADKAEFFIRKLWWWLAHHPAQIEVFGGSLRKLRFFEMLVLITSMALLIYNWQQRKSSRMRDATEPRQLVFAAFLLAMFLAMLGQLLPILHNSRYSSGLLDPWLIPLTAFGIARLTAAIQWQGSIKKDCLNIGLTSRAETSIWPPLVTMAILVLATFTGYNAIKKHEFIAINPKQIGQTKILLDILESSRVETYGMSPQSAHTWTTTASPAVLHVQIDSEDIQHITSTDPLNALWQTDIALRSNGQRCRKAEVAYYTADSRILQPRQRLPLQLPLQANGEIRSLVTHANHELRPHEPGSLRMVLDCPIGTSVDWRGTRLLESRHIWDAAAHIKH